MTKDLALLIGNCGKSHEQRGKMRRYQPRVGRQMLCTQSRELCNHVWLQALAREPGKASSDLSNL